VRIVVDQPIAASADAVQAAFLDPSFYESLGAIESITAPAVRSFSSSGKQASFVLAYRFSGQLNGVAKMMLDPAKLTWSQETVTDLVSGRSQVRMAPDNYANLLSFSGWYEFREEGEESCCQHMEAELRVHVPLVGGLAELAIAGSVRENVALTAHLVEQYLLSNEGRARPQ